MHVTKRGFIVADIPHTRVYFMCRHIDSFVRAKQVNREDVQCRLCLAIGRSRMASPSASTLSA